MLQRNPLKLNRTTKVWYLLLRVFWLILPKFNFWKGDRALGYVTTQIWDFPNICLFPNILSLKSFGNSFGNSYSKFAILVITFRFTSGWSDLYQNIVNFQNIMTKIVHFNDSKICKSFDFCQFLELYIYVATALNIMHSGWTILCLSLFQPT